MDVSDEKIKYLGVFLDLLIMTRTLEKFKSWNLKAVSKAFKWADIISRMGGEIFFLSRHLRPIGIEFVDINSTVVLTEPHETLLKCILTSPFLGMISDSENIVQNSLFICSSLIGEQRTIEVSSSVVKKAIEYQLQWKIVSDKEKYEAAATAIAFEFLMVMWHSLEDSNGNKFNTVALTHLANSFQSDSSIFSNFCNALSLPLVWIDFYLSHRLSSLSKPCTSTDLVNYVCKSRQLWDLVEQVIRDNVYLLLALNSETIRIVCETKPQLGLDILQSSLADLTLSSRDDSRLQSECSRAKKALENVYRNELKSSK